MKRDPAPDGLTQLVCQAAEAMLSALPEPNTLHHRFSPDFLARMDQLCTHVRRREAWQRFGRSVAAVFLALLIASGVFLSVESPARADFLLWVREVYENSVMYRFWGKALPSAVLPDLEFGWLPEGFAMTSSDGGDTMRFAFFTHESHEMTPIIFEYHFMDSGTSSMLMFTDDYLYEQIIVNGRDAHWYLSINSTNSNELIWFDEKENIMFSLSAFLDKSIMLHIAESMILVE